MNFMKESKSKNPATKPSLFDGLVAGSLPCKRRMAPVCTGDLDVMWVRLQQVDQLVHDMKFSLQLIRKFPKELTLKKRGK